MLLVCGFGWTASGATLISELQLFLPGWVRARAIAIYPRVFLGAQATTSPLRELCGLSLGHQHCYRLVSKVPASHTLDLSSLAYWSPAPVLLQPEANAGPIVVSIEYDVTTNEAADFLGAMAEARRLRLRSGASRWNLFRIGERPSLFVEHFQVPTWQELQLQHDGRLTAENKALEDAAFAYIVGSPRKYHLLPAAAQRHPASN